MEVPWGRPGSGFTYLFESFVMIIAREMSVSAVSRMLDEHDTRIWRILRHYVGEARGKEDLYGVTNEAVDKVRKQEQKDRPELKKTRYLWLKNPENLTNKQRKQFNSLSDLNLMTAKAYQIKLNFQEFWNQSAENAEEFLKNWCLWTNDSNLEPMHFCSKNS